MADDKKCTKCGVKYPATAEYFNRASKASSGLTWRCKRCQAEYQQWRRTHMDELPIRSRPIAREGYKYCTKCWREFPQTVEFFHRATTKGGGFSCRCRGCRSVATKRTVLYHLTEGHKACAKCGIEYPATNEFFSPRSSARSALYGWCRNCRNAHGAEYRASNAESQRKRSAVFRSKHKAKLREASLAYKSANRERIRISSAQYKAANLERSRIDGHRRRARKKSLPATFTNSEWMYALEYFNGCCAVCKRPLNDLFGTHKAHADHWIPLDSPECPGTIATNMIPLCGGRDGCNQSKNKRDPFEWLEWKFGKRKAKQIMARINLYIALVAAGSGVAEAE